MAASRSIRILITEDSGPMRHVIKSNLEDLYFENYTEATNGKEALELLGQEKFDLLLLDWQMPEMTGIELLAEIRKSDSQKDLKVLMITAEGSKAQIIEAAKLGVNGYIIKPFDAFSIGKQIEKIFK